jgi:hypothetical protein
MSLEHGAISALGDSVPTSLEEKERPKKLPLEEYLVKESFVPAGHGARTRKIVVRRRKVEELSPFAAVCAWVVEHQIGRDITQSASQLIGR